MLSVDGKLISTSLKLSSSRLPRFKYIPVQVMRTNINDVKISKQHIIVLRTSYTYVLYYNNIVLMVLLYTEYYHKNNDSTWTRRYPFFILVLSLEVNTCTKNASKLFFYVICKKKKKMLTMKQNNFTIGIDY